MTVLVSFSGLPGVGKTTLARHLGPIINAVHLRVDSAETAMRSSVLELPSIEDLGYLALAAVAKDNLLLGFNVIADTVNPIEITRDLWAATAKEGTADLLNVEVVCSDKSVHRARVEGRESDIVGLVCPTWERVIKREFEPWLSDRIIVDTSTASIEENVARIVDELEKLNSDS